ncbi:MAG: DNA translocase FtsK [Gemmatimonadota bacterium]|nr:DNA translocase FtsK [Gemmatimonadota bacterium]MDE2829477.1 DNA translocase FtsK [Gemmatimonadota bacterium]
MEQSSKALPETQKDRLALPFQILGVCLIAIALLMALSLLSHSPEDPPNSTRPNELAQNLVGWLGAHISYHLLFSVGYGAYALIVLAVVCGWNHLRMSSVRSLVMYSVILFSLMVIYCGATGVLFWERPTMAWKLGGWLGFMLSSSLLVPYLGTVGSYISLITLFVVLLMVATDIPFNRIPEWTFFKKREEKSDNNGIPPEVVQVEDTDQIEDTDQKKNIIEEEIVADPILNNGEKDELAEVPNPEMADDIDEENIDELLEKHTKETVADPVPDVDQVDSEENQLVEAPTSEIADDDSENQEKKEAVGTDPIPDVARVEREETELSEIEFEIVDKTPEPEPEPEPVPSKPKKKIVRKPSSTYLLPNLKLLEDPPPGDGIIDRETLFKGAQALEQSLSNFGVQGKVVQVNPGPVITTYEVAPPPGVKVSKIVGLADDLALVMKAQSIRIQAPIPGKAAVGIEVPNPEPYTVFLKEILESRAFEQSDSKLMLGFGKTASGDPYCADLAKMPHLLIAGATGAGKSGCINALISSILFRCTPEEVRFIMVDPKMLELSIYNDIPHLLAPVVVDPKMASGALKWAVSEMENRYRTMAQFTARNITDFNAKMARLRQEAPTEEDRDEIPDALPYIVVVIDELADLMMTAPSDIESSLARLAQMARAVGIHLIIATQRPSVNVITGTIKANFPTRIAFRVASKVDSRTIIDANGGEKLLGRGDMLFLPPGQPEPIRLHGAWIDTEETEQLVAWVRDQGVELDSVEFEGENSDLSVVDNERDARFDEALRLVVIHQQGSASLLQRRMKVGYSRAARLVDELEAAGIVGPPNGSSKGREVLVDEDYLEELEELDV